MNNSTWKKILATIQHPHFRPQVKRFVILFVGRTGSSYLLGLLKSHPQIRAFGEETHLLKEKGAQVQMDWIRSALTAPLLGRYGAVGFKTKLVDIADLNVFSRILREKQVQIVHMQRRNRVKAVVSRVNATRLWEATHRWNLRSEKDRLPPMVLEPERFDVLLAERLAVEEELQRFVTGLHMPVLSLYYEDLLVQRDEVLRQVYLHLGVPYLPTRTDTLKNTSDDLRQVLINYDELVGHYRGTVYEPMFGEVVVPEGLKAL